MRRSLNTQIFLGAIGGIALGIWLNTLGAGHSFSKSALFACDIVGGIFINALKMILIPLVFTSIAAGIGNLKSHAQMGRVWKITLIYFLVSPAIAVLLGMFLVNAVKPGQGLDVALFQESMAAFSAARMTLPEFFQTFLSGLFMNPFAALAQGQVLPTVVFAIVLGIALVISGEKTRGIQKLLNEFFDVVMMLVHWVMYVGPLGVMALLTKLVATQNPSLFTALGKFIGVVIFGTLFHGIVILPLGLYIFTRVTPLVYFRGMREALITALATSSSSATLPVTLKCTQENLKVDKNIVGFVAPLGATLNMDGTALYEAVAAVFVANLVGIDLNLFQQAVVFLTAILASIGAPGIPSAGMVTMVMVLQSVGLPIEAIAILIPIDRPLDAIRTAVNVEGDAVCSLIVQRYVTPA